MTWCKFDSWLKVKNNHKKLMIAGMIIPYGNQDETLKKLENNFIVEKNELIFFSETL